MKYVFYIYFLSVKLNLEGYSPHNLNYLKCGDTKQDEAEDGARFQAWKACLGKAIIFINFYTLL